MLHDTVVIEGEVSLINQIDGDPDVFIGGGGITPTGTKSILLTEAGTKTEDVTDYAYAEINAVKSATASGAVASFSDGAEDVLMDSCLVNIEPVQDLHGYDNPWSAGGGKNLLNPTGVTVTTNGITFTMNSDGTVVASGTATAQAVFTYSVTEYQSSLSGEYVLNGNPTGSSSSTYRMRIRSFSGSDWGSWVYANSTEDRSVTLTDATKIEVHIIVLSGQTISNLVFKPMFRLASVTDATFAPYSNICPISGWSEVNVTRTGKNVYSYDSDNAEVATTSEQTQRAIYHTGIKGGTWTISGTINQTLDTYINIGEFKNSIATLKSSWANGSSVTTKTVTISDDAELIFMSSATTIDRITTNLSKMTIQIELGSTATSYEPYTGAEYPVSLGQTVYGGTLDVVSGVLTVTHGYIASYAGETLPSTWISDRDVYVQGTTPTTGAQVVYELATPTTVQLTPTEVTTLLGSNNVWADSGDIAVGYKADAFLSQGTTPTGTKAITITANGTTTEDVTNYASAEITTNVPASAVDTGTKAISSNGTHDVVGYANASVNVPNSYSASDEGKVVSNGALVAQTSDTVTANDTYDTTLINSLTVNVSGGGGYTWNEVTMTSTFSNASAAVTKLFGSSTTGKGGFAYIYGKNQSAFINNQLYELCLINAGLIQGGGSVRYRNGSLNASGLTSATDATCEVGDVYKVLLADI